jgi:hypothetical protein
MSMRLWSTRQFRQRVDLKGLRREIDDEIIRRHTSTSPVAYVRLQPRTGG